MPKFRDLKRYCERTGWVQVGRGRDHYYYEKVLPNGEILRTKVSHSLSRGNPLSSMANDLEKTIKNDSRGIQQTYLSKFTLE